MNHYFEICHYQQNVRQHYYLLDTLHQCELLHPIVCDTLNICSLYSSNKLTKLSARGGVLDQILDIGVPPRV